MSYDKRNIEVSRAMRSLTTSVNEIKNNTTNKTSVQGLSIAKGMISMK